MKYFINNLCYIFIFISLLNCSDDNVIPEEIIPPVPVRESSYVMAVKNGGTESFLLDKNGDVVFNWTFDLNLGNDLELLPDGKLIGMFKTTTPSFFFGGYGGIVRILNVDGSIHWEYEHFSENYLAHHDVELLANGNVLFLAWERIPAATAKQAGVDTEFDIYPEVLIEVNPDTDEIVWEWHSFDHIIQDRFANLSTFGDIGDNPQLIDFNYSLRDNGDIMHANGIDYDPTKDVIYVSVNFYSEVWVIDHSTSKEEAGTSLGGNFDNGGNLIYRFGNPGAYNNTGGVRLFYNNHFPNFLEADEPGAGNVLIYVNSDKNADQSAVYELKMPETFNLSTNTNNEPEIVWSFTDTELFYQRISGAVRLKNGNTLICEGDFGFWEVATGGEVVWKFDVNEQGDFWRAYAYGINSPEVMSLGL